MKKIIFSLFAVLMIGGTSVFAQGKYGPDSAECIKYLSYYKEYFKQKSYDSALPNWRKAYSLCPPTANQTMLIDGTSLMRYLIGKNSKNAIYKDALVDSLITIHRTRAQYYPKYAVTAMNNMGLDMINYVKDDPQALYDGLNEVIEANGEDTRANIFLFKINTAVSLYQTGALTAEDVIEDYEQALAMISKMTPKNDIEKQQNDKVKTDIESLFITSKIASCDKLISLFTPRFEANPDDLETVSSIVMMMGSTEGCTDNELFLNAVTKMHELDPSYNTAYFLYRLYNSRNDIDNAIKYMEEAIAYPESDSLQDGAYCYELATACFKAGHSAKAFSTALKAIEYDPTLAGKSYMLIGTIWGSLVCQGNEIETRAPYWVAIDYLVKARIAAPTLAEEANKLIGQYSTYFPQTGDAFMYGITNGDSYTVSCGGMRAVTTVRTQD